jgi:hypothetical protein
VAKKGENTSWLRDATSRNGQRKLDNLDNLFFNPVGAGSQLQNLASAMGESQAQLPFRSSCNSGKRTFNSPKSSFSAKATPS